MSSKVERSKHYDEIIEMLTAGKSSRAISKHLKEAHNESISNATISRFKKNKYNKMIIAEANRIRKKNETVNNTDTFVTVDCVETVGNQFNKLLKLNNRALEILNEKLYDNTLNDKELITYAFKCVELTAKYSFKQYFDLEHVHNIEENKTISNSAGLAAAVREAFGLKPLEEADSFEDG